MFLNDLWVFSYCDEKFQIEVKWASCICKWPLYLYLLANTIIVYACRRVRYSMSDQNHRQNENQNCWFIRELPVLISWQAAGYMLRLRITVQCYSMLISSGALIDKPTNWWALSQIRVIYNTYVTVKLVTDILNTCFKTVISFEEPHFAVFETKMCRRKLIYIHTF